MGCIEVELGKSYAYLSEFDSAQHYLALAENSLKKMDYSDVRVKDLDAEIQNSKAMNFYYVGKIDSAIVYLKKNIEIIDQIGNKKSSAFAKINLGSIYSSISDFSSSARYYLKAYQELADLKTLDDRRVAVLAGNLAKVYYELEKRDSSIHWAKGQCN